MMFEQRLQLSHVVENPPAHARPTDRLRLPPPLAADVDDVVLDLPRAELALALGLVAADRVRRFQVEAGFEQALKHRDPGCILAVVERECQRTAGLEDAVALAPAGGQDALVERVGVVRVTRAVRNRLQGLGRVFGRELIRMAVAEREP